MTCAMCTADSAVSECSSCVRHEKPSATITASVPALRTPGRNPSSAMRMDRSWCSASNPHDPARPQQPLLGFHPARRLVVAMAPEHCASGVHRYIGVLALEKFCEVERLLGEALCVVVVWKQLAQLV